MSTVPATHRLRMLWTVLGPAGRFASLVAALAIVVLLFSLRSLTRAALTSPAPSGAEVAQDQKLQAEKFAKAFEGYLAQVNGRSLFFTPPPPRRETKTTTASEESHQPPARYGGPALVGFANDAAYFSDGRKIKVGDESDSTFQVKKLLAPWSAVVHWQGAEFTVGLFDRDRLVYPTPGAAAEPARPEEKTDPAPRPAPPAPAPAADAKTAPAAGTSTPTPAPDTKPKPEDAPKTDGAPKPEKTPETDSTAPKGARGEPA